MDSSTGRSSWVGTQLRVFAVSGLERSHSKPFVRLVYTDHAGDDDLRIESSDRVDLRALESSSSPVERLPDRNSARYYTVRWADSSKTADECSFTLPARVNWVELQVWNRFPSGFDVFLAKTALSVEQLRSQSVGDSSDKSCCSHSTGCMWTPLQVLSRCASPDLRGLKLSAQLAVDFLYDDRVAQIRQRLSSRKTAKTDADSKNPGSSSVGEGDSSFTEVTDPTFAFTAPFLQVEWSVVAAASVRQLFFYNDVDRVEKFREIVLYGDVARELAGVEDDDDEYSLYVDPGHLTAFQVAQFAAQYLSHCVDSLDTRVEEYTDQLRSLSGAAQHLRHQNRALRHQRKRLEQERDQLALVIETYENLGQRGNVSTAGPATNNSCTGSHVAPVARPSLGLDIDSRLSPTTLPSANNTSARDEPVPIVPSSPLSAKKPTFIMTWEDRERERQREKEVTKAQRVQEEQRRLQQRLEERAVHDKQVAEAARRRDQSARVLQRSLRRRLWIQRWRTRHRTRETSTRAATVIQARVRQWRLTRAFPVVRERLRREREQRWMSEEDTISRQCIECIERPGSAPIPPGPEEDIDAGQSSLERPGSPSQDDVELLVSTWRTLRRVIRQQARRHGQSGFHAVFRALDLRQDGVIDRAEMRRGVLRHFNVHLNRKLTRGIIALIRGKAGEPPRPLSLTFAQFVRGLDLARSDTVRSSGGSIASDAQPNIGSSLVDEEAVGMSLHQPSPDQSGGLYDVQHLGEHSSGVEDADNATVEHETIDRRLEAVAVAVQVLRKAVRAAATGYLAASGAFGGAPSYRDFRAALVRVFASFDSDGNGQLDMRELGACLASLGVRVTDQNLALVRECFCSSTSDFGATDGGDGTVTIADFVSFVLSGASTTGPAEELGLLGYHVRSAVMERTGRVRALLAGRGEPASEEDAMRWVFRSAYPGKRRECSLREFARALRGVKGLESLPPAKMARVAARLDRDGDHNVSFDELLAWFGLVPASTAPATTSPAVDTVSILLSPPADPRAGFRAVLKDAAMRVQWLREWLSQIASSTLRVDHAATSKAAHASSLFDHIDANDSGKIARDELESFFTSLLYTAIQVASGSGEIDVSVIAAQLVDVVDFSGNGVVTRDEWLRFTMDADAPIAEEFAVRTALRRAVESASGASEHGEMISLWLERLPGAIPIATRADLIDGVRHFRIRVGEFKTAVRKAIDTTADGSSLGEANATSAAVPDVASALDAATKQLDTDGSGWITTQKLLTWLFPTRDLEELLRLLRSRWKQQPLGERSSPAEHADKLYSRFDADGNGCLARRELKAGFEFVLGLRLVDREVDALVSAFDADGDRLWNRNEFLAFAQQVVQLSGVNKKNTASNSPRASNPQPDDAVESKPTTSAKPGDRSSDDYSHDDEPLLLSSSASSSGDIMQAAPPFGTESASVGYSDGSFQGLSASAASATASVIASPARPTEYDDDFDEL